MVYFTANLIYNKEIVCTRAPYIKTNKMCKSTLQFISAFISTKEQHHHFNYTLSKCTWHYVSLFRPMLTYKDGCRGENSLGV